MQSRITKINEGLESLISYVNVANVDSVMKAFSGIIQSEKLKNQKVELLNTRKANITQNLDYLNTNMNAIKILSLNARNIYNSIGKINNTIQQIQSKRSLINGSVAACLPQLCGCDASHYKVLCDVLDSVVASLTANLSGLNASIIQIGMNS